MGSYTSVMNDTSGTLYITYAPNVVALDVVEVVTAVLGVIAAVATGAVLVVGISSPIIIAMLGISGGSLSLAQLLTAAIDITAKNEGYHAVAPGNSYRSDKLTLSLIHQADVKLIEQVNSTAIDMWSGSFTVFTGATAGSTRRYLLSQELSKLNFKLVVIQDTSDDATGLFSNFTLVHTNSGFAEKLALQQSCSLAELD
ncbi:hypothetical protein B0H11DRAFT_1925977 [Mycena galericulata]|nr:hypothetical protein B0H11DRAFT_1925977 [Mycena galericulata]